MGSKPRLPPSHLRPHHPPISGAAAAGFVRPDPYGPGPLPPRPHPPILSNAQFPPYDLLPPRDVLEQKLIAQQLEMQKLATENRRLASTHRTLRQELAAAKHELQMLNAHIGAAKAESERQVEGLKDQIAQMEKELKSAEPVRSELHQARQDAENFIVARDELMVKVHRLRQDLHRAHSDVQQIPSLMSELETLRHEYQRCSVSYENEKKFYSDHYESLQVMEKNYVTMSKEVEKLRSQLSSYSVTPGNNGNEMSRHPSGQNVGQEGYSVPQGQVHVSYPSYSSGATVANAGTAAHVIAGSVAAAYIGVQSGTASLIPAYTAPTGPSYDGSKGSGCDSQMLQYGVQRPGYDAYRSSYIYDMQQGAGYDPATLAGHIQGANYSTPGVASKPPSGPHMQVVPANNTAYGSAAKPVAPLTEGSNPARR